MAIDLNELTDNGDKAFDNETTIKIKGNTLTSVPKKRLTFGLED